MPSIDSDINGLPSAIVVKEIREKQVERRIYAELDANGRDLMELILATYDNPCCK